eukprot:2388167-Prymnesium_polylepis.1
MSEDPSPAHTPARCRSLFESSAPPRLPPPAERSRRRKGPRCGEAEGPPGERGRCQLCEPDVRREGARRREGRRLRSRVAQTRSRSGRPGRRRARAMSGVEVSCCWRGEGERTEANEAEGAPQKPCACPARTVARTSLVHIEISTTRQGSGLGASVHTRAMFVCRVLVARF